MNWHDHWVPVTTAADTSDQLIASVYVSLCGQRGSRDVDEPQRWVSVT